MTRIRACALAALFFAGACSSTPKRENQDTTVDALQKSLQAAGARADQLEGEKATLDRKVAELQAQLDKSKSAEKAVQEAKGEISEHVKQVLDHFRGDRDIEVERTKGGYRFVLREAVLFSSGSATLTAEGKKALQRVADALRGGRTKIQIEGHTDDRPVAKAETLKKFPRGNMELSVERALSVWEYLVKDGKIAKSRMGVCGYGANRPRVPNDSDRNRWRNRRVEIRVEEN